MTSQTTHSQTAEDSRDSDASIMVESMTTCAVTTYLWITIVYIV